VNREVIDLTRTHEPYWDRDNVLRYRRRSHARPRYVYELGVVRDGILLFLAIVAIVVVASMVPTP
jgi:hypothetical protein